MFAPAQPETIFTYGAPALKFGPGSRHEIAHDLTRYACRNVLIVTDAGVAGTGAPAELADQIRATGVSAVVFDGTRVEPTDASLIAAVEFARASGPFDAIIAIGGGSSIDTAKAVNLLVTNDGELMDFINAPVGRAKAPSKPLLPLIAVPTTTGTGSESTTICVLDVVAQNVKTGISHVALRPTYAVVDPELTLTQPAGVTAASGLDVLCHALESYTARPYAAYESKRASERVPYCGSNPIADLWAQRAMSLMSNSFVAAVEDGANVAAREQMALAATFAGLGFGNAGVHIPHANAYPIAGQVGDYQPGDYPANDGATGHGLVPHGMAVSMTAPAAFRFTFDAAPERHVEAARLLDPTAEMTANPADFLPTVLTSIMRAVSVPSGLAELGFGAGDLARLAEGTMKQQRLLSTAPRAVSHEDVVAILADSIELW